MDNKRTIFAMLLTLGLISLWLVIKIRIDRAHPEWAEYERLHQQPTSAPARTVPPNPATAPTNATTEQLTTGPSISTAPAAAGFHVVDRGVSSTGITLGSDIPKDPNWSMQLKLTPTGAGVERVTLNEFQKAVKDSSRYSFQTPYEDHPGAAPLATRFIEIDGHSIDISAVAWKLEKNDETSATYSLDLAEGDGQLVHLAKSYELPRRNTPSKGYEVPITYAIENRSGRVLKVKTGWIGPTVPPKEVERGADRQILVGYGDGASIGVVQHVAEEFKKDKVFQELTENKGHRFMWAGAGSVYFVSFVLPNTSEGASAVNYSLSATALNPDDEDHNEILTQLDSSEMIIAAGQSAKLPLTVYFGPKKREVLEGSYYAAFPRMYDRVLLIGGSYCSFCTFSWLVNFLVLMLSFFHGIFRDWGLAIIALVLVVRLCLHPITKRSQVQMMKMGKMGPEMERLKAKYADDKDALNKAMMQFYKEQGMAPVLGCLPMFLQMPIWIALWTALQTTFELRLSPFLQFGRVHLTWISDLARPDMLFTFPTFTIPLVGVSISSFNLLPILLAIVFYMQQKYTPKPVAATKEQEQQQKWMTVMSTLMFPIFLYKGPAGLNLYIFASTAAGIIESKVVRDHIKQREEAEKAGRVFVETRPTRAARRREDREQAGPKKPSGKWAAWLAELQEKAEQMRKEGGRNK